ncbi:HNH endonuclease [Microterricola gilva]|uniref:HNH endonuclease n=1 Tax=Microterricola gilva TaxID=393267 RepID=A0A4Q8AMG2_9MICO|nr:HNH endonuclease signature motif containing protein [Microterricola gilva]RZU65193.1 HNH endonuclease [Microterricola gilva]
MSEALLQLPGSATDPVITGCLNGLAAVQSSIGAAQAEQYRFIETARAHAIATADPMGKSRRIEEEFALRSITSELALALRVHERTMTGLIYEAKQLGTIFTRSLAALAAGTVGQRHVREILAQAVTLPPELHARFEAEALLKAATQTPTAFRRTAARIRERLHPDSLTVRAAKGRAERRLWFEPDADGMAWLHLHLEAEKAIAITERISHLADQAQAEALDTADLPDTAGALTSGTHAQLEADIAAELLLSPPAGGTSKSRMPGLAFSRPEVFVAVPKLTIPCATLVGQSDDPAELHGYGPIDADTARRLVAAAPTLHRILVDPVDGTPLQLDPRKYPLTKALRRWILYRDQICRFPGCTRKAERAEIDHTQPFGYDGLSEEDNLAVLCKKHHRLKHNSRWRVRQLGQGGLRWVSPAGRIYDTHPAPPSGRRPPGDPPAPPFGPPPPVEPVETTADYPDTPPF